MYDFLHRPIDFCPLDASSLLDKRLKDSNRKNQENDCNDELQSAFNQNK